MLRFEADVLATDLRSRTIEGVIVPYNEVGVIAGREYRFRPGSLKLARSRTPLLVDHDRARPIGVLAELVDGPAGAIARFSIDDTPDGDHALIQASSGSRGSLSIGAEVELSRIDSGGVVDVEAGAVYEVSLLALGAFAGATVTRVAAELADDDHQEDELEEPATPAEPDANQTELELEPEHDDDDDDAGAAGDPDDPEEGSTMEASSAAPVIITAGADRPHVPELGAGELVSYIVRAQHGEPEARRFLEAAMVESISTDVSGLLPPSYERTVIGSKATPRPLYETFGSRPLPGVGLLVNKPKWTTPPDGAWAATVDDDAHSTKIIIGSQAANVERWDWAGAIPWVVVQRSDPSIVDVIYAEAVEDFYFDVETKIYTELSAAGAGTATSLGAAIAEFYATTKRTPDVILMAGDVWGKMADAGALAITLGQGGIGAGGSTLTASFAGIEAVTSGSLAPGEVILATRRAVDARITDPVRLTANAIGALNVELAVVGEGLFDTDYPAELMKFAAVIPVTASLGGGRSK